MHLTPGEIMANKEHLVILEQGVEAWNKWRKENPGVTPDLWDANLKDRDLHGVNFTTTNLGEANLSHSNLSGAYFRSANLVEANLGETNLSKANLNGANLRGAELGKADLSNALLFGADFSEANLGYTNLRDTDFSSATLDWALLNGADVTDATFGFTSMGNLDLRDVIGLDRVIHGGPSSIGIDTIFESGGKIPEAFLRGAGVPDEFIAYLPALMAEPFRYYSCFISHSAKDKTFCARLYADLKVAHVRTWYFPEDAKWGQPVWGEINQSIKIYDKLVLVCSLRSLMSGPVLRELERALNREDREGRQVLFPITIDDFVFKKWQHPRKDDVLAKVVGDFRSWKDHDVYQKSFARLLGALQAEPGQESA